MGGLRVRMGDRKAILAFPLSPAASIFPRHLQECDSFPVLSRTALIAVKSGDPFAPLGQFLALRGIGQCRLRCGLEVTSWGRRQCTGSLGWAGVFQVGTDALLGLLTLAGPV